MIVVMGTSSGGDALLDFISIIFMLIFVVEKNKLEVLPNIFGKFRPNYVLENFYKFARNMT
jgi:hypothetical protein